MSTTIPPALATISTILLANPAWSPDWAADTVFTIASPNFEIF